ncbi:Crp/Fnr family transcriptional regulator [Candidatus Microgenomates bacterium]|nr:Crp/Fnr family transcriptional regulator [Candidatus Microgenomates bacterium]
MTAVELWRVSRNQFLDFIKANPDILFELTSRITVRLGGLLERMEYLVFGNAHQKVASILAICAQRFGRQEGGKTKISVPLTHKDIAALIGFTRETVSLEMKKLEKKGIISRRGQLILVKNSKKLEDESILNTTASGFF